MGHEHKVHDTDAHFIINPITKAIKSEANKKNVLIQGDHNSERYTFEIARYIEGHDMSECNQVEVHYFNISNGKDKEVQKGKYTVDDLQISADDENIVVCSWVVSSNATRFNGSLNFLVRFKCVEAGIVTYAWNTAFYKGLTVSEGSDADESFETAYVDIIEQWKASVMAEFTNDLNQWKAAKMAELEEEIADRFGEHSAEWNQKLAVERARINQFTKLAEGSTTGDAELQDIRVGADGITYDSAGTAIREQIGEVYNAMGLSVIVTNDKYTIVGGDGNKNAEIVGYIDVNGVRQATNSFRCTDFIKLHHSTIDINLIGYTYLCTVAYYDAEKTFISGLVGGASFEIQKGKQNVPDNAKYVRFSFLASESSLYAKVRSYPMDDRIAEIEEKANELAIEDYRDYTTMETTAARNGYIDIEGQIIATASWFVSGFVRITNAVRMDYSLQGIANMSIIAFYDKEKKHLNSIVGEASGLHKGKNVVPPADAVYLRFSTLKNYTDQYVLISYPIAKHNACEIQRLIESSPLHGKKLIATGDSITATTFNRQFASYAKMIADTNNMEYECNAVWGATIPDIEQGAGSVLTTIKEMSDDADYIILSGGANDWYYLTNGTEAFGEITSGYSALLDETTFCGALESVCKTAIEKWVGKKILYVITHKPLDVEEHRIDRIDEIVSGMILIFEKWGIPYVDLYHGMPSLFLPSFKNLYTTNGDAAYTGVGDGLHPNDEGYRKYYVPKVEAKLKSL